MKYVNPQESRLIPLTFVILACLLFGCAGNETKTDKPSAEAPKTLIPTKAFLPSRSYDKEGNLIPFTAMTNPYTEIKGKIDKQVIIDFIDARKAIKSENFDKARSLLKKITQADKTLAGPWVLLGQIAVTEKQPDLAKQHFEKAIAINPNNVNAYLPLALIERQKGEFIAAQNTYAAALQVWKDFPEAHLNLAILYDLYLNDPLQAQQHMEAYQFLSEDKNEQVAKWLDEIRSRTGIEPNLYIGPSSTSQIEKTAGDKG